MESNQNQWKNHQVLRAFREKDDKLLEQLYNDFRDLVIGHLINKNATQEQAEDIYIYGLQVVFEKTRNPKFEFTDSFKSYLFKVCENRFHKSFRRKKFQSEITIDQLAVLAINENDDDFHQADIVNLVYSNLKNLSEKCQELITLFYQTELDWTEIAMQTGYASDNSARQQKFRCIEKLKNQIRKTNPEFFKKN